MITPAEAQERARAWEAELRPAVDVVLTDRARQNRPRVRNWWGRRWLEGKNGARCYICDDWIATWDRRWPMTARAKSRIAVHRLMHIRQSLSDWTPQPEETT